VSSEIEVHYKHVNPHQWRFHSERNKFFARLISAGTGAGKTIAGAYEAVCWAELYPQSVGYAFEPTYKMVRRNLIPTLEKLLCVPIESHPLIANYHKTDNRLEFYNGSQMWMIGLDDPESAEGMNVDWIWSDETRLIRHIETAWQVWMRRLRGSVPNRYPVGIWLTTTPNEPGSFIHQLFEDPRSKLSDSEVYRWAIDDNPLLPESYRQKVKESHSGGMYKRFVQGLFAAVALGSFEFDYSVHVLDDIPLVWIKKVVYGVDFGWTNPSAIVVIGFDGDDRAYVLDEFYGARTSDETLIEEALNMQSQWGEGEFICDPSEPQTIDKMVKAGLNARGNKAKRDDGIREIGSRLKKVGDGRRRLYISSRCVNLISEMQVYDAKKKENDHAVDGMRYGLCNVVSGEIQVLTGKRGYW